MFSGQQSSVPSYYVPQQPRPYQYRYSRRNYSGEPLYQGYEWLYMADRLIHDIRMLAQDMKSRREVWREEREKRQSAGKQGAGNR